MYKLYLFALVALDIVSAGVVDLLNYVSLFQAFFERIHINASKSAHIYLHKPGKYKRNGNCRHGMAIIQKFKPASE